MKQAGLKTCIMTSVLLIIFSAYSLIQDEHTMKQEAAEYSNIKDLSRIPLSYEEVDEHLSADKQKQLDDYETVKFIYDWEALQSINPDIAGWISIPDSEIDYPVVTGNDNSYYLSHSFIKEKSRIGCLFLDYRSDSMHDNQVIYGHNMGSGKTPMFSTLIKWEDKEWYEEHNTLYYAPLNQETQAYIIFAVIKAEIRDVKKINLIASEFNDEQDFLHWIVEIKRKSIYETNITPQYGNKILTLMTCDRRVYGADGRLILFAVNILDIQ